MYFTQPEEGLDTSFSVSRMHTVLVTALLIPTIFFGIFWNTLHDWTQYGIEIMQNIN